MMFDENLLFTQALRNRLNSEAAMQSDIGTAFPAWFAVKSLERGRGKTVIERNYDPNGLSAVPDPADHQIIWAEAVSRILNHEIHHDGAWIVGLTHPPGFGEMLKIEPKFEWRRTIKVWIDRDGDPQFTCDCIDPWPFVAERGPEHFVEQSEQAWQHWKRLMRDALAPKDYQLKQLAKGTV